MVGLEEIIGFVEYRQAFWLSILCKNNGIRRISLKREIDSTNQKSNQNSDLSYTIWRNIGRGLKLFGL